jgi:large subunit ribosomal protein L34
MSFTYKPKKRKRAKTHGFLVRSRSKNGKRVIRARRRKGRAKLTV